MSIKVYDGWALRKGSDPFALAATIRAAIRAEAYKVLKPLAASLNDGWSELYKKAKEQATSPYKDAFDIRVELVFYRHDGRHYFRLMAGTSELQKAAERALRAFPACREYSYWDNTDESDGVSIREWRARGRVWNAIDVNGRLVMDVLDYNNLGMLPWEAREARKRRK